MRFTLPKARRILLTLFIALLAFVAGFTAGKKNFEFADLGSTSQVKLDRTVSRQGVDFNLFWQVWDKLGAEYFDKTKLDPERMVYGAIKGMVSAIGDPYTVFLPPEEQKRTQEDLGGEFEGVGIQIGFKGSQLAVIAPLEGTPAEKAGVKAGDFIVGIKDKAKEIDKGTFGITLPDAVDAIRGPAGSQVTLVLTRVGEDEPFEVELTRAKITVPSVKLSFVGVGDKIAHLKLLRFGELTNGEWDKAILNIKDEKAKSVILDLRNNPGGFLDGSLAISSEFLGSGVVVIQEDGKGGRQEMRVTGKPRLPDIKIVVLVNGGSASASEIVAGALMDNKRAKVVGEKTFGKGTIQESEDIGSAGLHITTAKWLTPSGTWVNGVGLKPDVEVADDLETEADEQLQAAVKLLQ
ncbi:MAG: S41 family peptidase [Candidatus Blackburnbacteria bacterium]|nr:S41 family peptidase [Candidatus Blackburnbacteria bacterium]